MKVLLMVITTIVCVIIFYTGSALALSFGLTSAAKHNSIDLMDSIIVPEKSFNPTMEGSAAVQEGFGTNGITTDLPDFHDSKYKFSFGKGNGWGWKDRYRFPFPKGKRNRIIKPDKPMAPVPEPTTILLSCVGLIGIAAVRHRYRQKNQD
jgi:hypothetical protein